MDTAFKNFFKVTFCKLHYNINCWKICQVSWLTNLN